MNKINVIIPMAGLGSRFTQYGFKTNKYLLPIDSNFNLMIDEAILTLNIINYDVTFIFIIKNDKDTVFISKHLQKICNNNNYKCIILTVDYITEGPASTSYIAKDYINNDVPLIISNSDQILKWDFDNFYNKSINYDGCVLTYKPNYKLVPNTVDKHSFVKFNSDNIPIEFKEKIVISDEALVGVHFYKKGKYFIEAYNYMINNNIRAPNNEFYLSLTYDCLLKLNYSIGTYCIDNINEQFFPVGEPEDYFKYYNLKSPIIVKDVLNFEYFNEFLNSKINNIVIKKLDKGNKIDIKNYIFILLHGSIDSDNIILFDITITALTDIIYITIDNIDYYLYYNKFNINNYIRGWFIGNFVPTIYNTNRFEVGLLKHYKDQSWDYHYHQYSDELNILLNGKMIINNITINKDTIFLINKNVIACPIFLEDCELICIKIPSLPYDKHII